MIKRFLVPVLATAALLMGINLASAAIVDLTWNGTTAFGGNDPIGLFGAPGPVPAGLPYVAKYRFDTSISFFENGTNGSQEVSGGVSFEPDRLVPLISSSITINGIEVNVGGGFLSSYFRSSGQGASQVSTLAQRLLDNPQPFGGELFQRVFRSGNFYGMQLDQPGDLVFDASDNPGGNFSYSNLDPAGNIIALTGVGLIPERVNISVVPEPASLAVAAMTLGVGLVAGNAAGSVRPRRRAQ